MDSIVTIVESQPDWLTVTCAGEHRLPTFRAWARNAIAWEETEHNQQRNFAAFGYEGVKCGRVRWGARDDGDMVQLSGDAAARELQRAMDLASNVSRVDLAVTVRIEPTQLDLEREHYAQFLGAPAREGRQATGSLVLSSDGGATFYLGKRTSDVMLRCYNKGIESNDPKYRDCHRYEVEVKGDGAILTATTLARSADPGEYCRSAVHDWVAGRGVTPAFTCAQPMRLERGFKRRSDQTTKLEWLTRSVSPTVAWLRTYSDEGKLLGALGLGDLRRRSAPGVTEGQGDASQHGGEGEVPQ